MRHERAYLIFVLDHTGVYSTKNKKEKKVIRVKLKNLLQI